jgi:hypothetical protein
MGIQLAAIEDRMRVVGWCRIHLRALGEKGQAFPVKVAVVPLNVILPAWPPSKVAFTDVLLYVVPKPGLADRRIVVT